MAWEFERVAGPYRGPIDGLAWDGAYLWVGEESGRIYKMNTTGDTI